MSWVRAQCVVTVSFHPAMAVRKAVETSEIFVSETTMNELAAVLSRPKFDRYVSQEDRQRYLRLISRIARMIPIIYPVRACRDAKDDKFLEVAVNARALLIVTVDADLLILHPFQEIAILTPTAYLAM